MGDLNRESRSVYGKNLLPFLLDRKIGLALFSALSIALTANLLTQLHASAANTFTGNNVLVSVDVSGNLASHGGGGKSIPYGVSSDGNKVLFSSDATNMPGYSSSVPSGVFLRNISTGTTTRVDTSTSGIPANGPDSGLREAFSETGRYAVFVSGATNLIDSVTAPAYAMYMKDLQTGTTIALLTDGSGTPIRVGTNSYPVAVSNDGRFVLVSTTEAYLFIPGTRTGYSDVVLLDTVTHTTKLLDLPASGPVQSANSVAGGMDCNGSFIVFQSSATNLVSTYSGSGMHIYLADMRSGLSLSDLTSGATVDSTQPGISCNGDTIDFGTKARNLVTPTPSGMDTNYHIVDYSRITGAATYIDSDSSGNFPNSESSFASVSDGGDLALPWTYTTGGTTYKPLVIKHASDGSGTLEYVEKTPSGSYLTNYDSTNGNLFLRTWITPDSKYVVYPTREACQLQTLVTGCAYETEIVRSETGIQNPL